MQRNIGMFRKLFGFMEVGGFCIKPRRYECIIIHIIQQPFIRENIVVVQRNNYWDTSGCIYNVKSRLIGNQRGSSYRECKGMISDAVALFLICTSLILQQILALSGSKNGSRLPKAVTFE